MKINGCDVAVKYNATKGCPAKIYESNGDYGHPAEPNEVEIESVVYKGIDVLEILGEQAEELEMELYKLCFEE